jgi:hypothetical protein
MRLPVADQRTDHRGGTLAPARPEGTHSSTAGNSDFLKRQPTEPSRIPYSGLRELNNLLCNNLGDGIGPVAQLQGSQAILVGCHERSDIFGCKG